MTMGSLLQRFFIFLLIFSFITGQLIRLNFFGVVFPLLDASVLLFVGYSIISHKFSKEKYFANKYFLLFATALIVGNLINYHAYSGVENLKGNLYLARFILYSLVMGIKWSGQTWKSVPTTKIINYIGGIIASIGILQFVFLPDLRFLQYQNWDDHWMRLTFPYLDPSFTGAILLVFLIFTFLSRDRSRPVPTTEKFIFLLELIALILTFSRATWITTGIVLTFIFLNSKISIKKIIVGMGVIGIAILFVVGTGLRPVPWGGSQTLPYGNKLTRIETLNSRLTGINKSLQIWQKNPIFGVGFNHYLTYQLKNGFDVKNGENNRGEASVENSFVFVLVTSGIIGFVCFVLWIVNLMHTFKGATFKVLLTILIGSLFNNLFFYPFILLVIFAIIYEKKP